MKKRRPMISEKIFLVVTFPLWLPLAVFGGLLLLGNLAICYLRRDDNLQTLEQRVRKRVSQCVWGTIEEAWARCCTAMKAERAVGYSTGFGLCLGDELVSALVRNYPDQQPFFIKQLTHPNPVFAAYAAVYLGRRGSATTTDIPSAVFERTESVRVQRGAKYAENCSLGKFIAERVTRASV